MFPPPIASDQELLAHRMERVMTGVGLVGDSPEQSLGMVRTIQSDVDDALAPAEVPGVGCPGLSSHQPDADFLPGRQIEEGLRARAGDPHARFDHGPQARLGDVESAQKPIQPVGEQTTTGKERLEPLEHARDFVGSEWEGLRVEQCPQSLAPAQMLSGKNPSEGFHGHKLTLQEIAALRSRKRPCSLDQRPRPGQKIPRGPGPSPTGFGAPCLWSEVGVYVIWIVALEGKDQPDVGIRHVVNRFDFRLIVPAARP